DRLWRPCITAGAHSASATDSVWNGQFAGYRAPLWRNALGDPERNEPPLVDHAVVDYVQGDARRKAQSGRGRWGDDRPGEAEARALALDLVQHRLGRVEMTAEGKDVAPLAEDGQHLRGIGTRMPEH